MNSLDLHSGGSSTADISDLDGFSVPEDFGYSMQAQFGSSTTDDFGFDPPGQGTVYPKLESYSPQHDTISLANWAGFEDTDSKKHNAKNSGVPNTMQGLELDRMISQTLPASSNAIARYGTLTPPRSNSASSEEHHAGADEHSSPTVTSTSPRRKRSSKVVLKEETTISTSTTTGRKRKSSRKQSIVSDEQDDKRRQSLEKNRLAAAKCRVNKKEKTEQLQRDSHEKAVHNAFLKDQVIRMNEELQQMNALLLTHANCEGCKSPEEIRKHLSKLGNEFFNNHMTAMNYGDYHQVNGYQDMHSDYFGQGDGGVMNQTLPDFDRGADFEVHTPMQTD